MGAAGFRAFACNTWHGALGACCHADSAASACVQASITAALASAALARARAAASAAAFASTPATATSGRCNCSSSRLPAGLLGREQGAELSTAICRSEVDLLVTDRLLEPVDVDRAQREPSAIV